MIFESVPVADNVQILADDQTMLGARLLKAMQQSLYSNRMRIAPRRIKEVAQEEMAALLQFLAVRDRASVVERGRQLMGEGLGQRSIVDMTSALRLASWEIASRRPDVMEVVALFEEYTSALLSGYMAAYEEDQRREQQRTHEAFVRSLAPGSNGRLPVEAP